MKPVLGIRTNLKQRFGSYFEGLRTRAFVQVDYTLEGVRYMDEPHNLFMSANQ